MGKPASRAIRNGLKADKHHVALRHVVRVVVDQGPVEVKRPRTGIYLQAVLLDERVVAMKQEMDIMPALGQTRAVVAADATGPDYGIAHVPWFFHARMIPNHIRNCHHIVSKCRNARNLSPIHREHLSNRPVSP